MNYDEAMKYIEETGRFGMKLGLQRIQRLCDCMGNPEGKLKVIHVAGTNGKGSTTTFISSILMAQGYRVGIYTSPYLERFTERIKINHEEISREDVAKYVTDLIPIINKVSDEIIGKPTQFEIITAMAFKYFKDKGTDYVVLEVGLGGRMDSTNIVDPLLSVITTISYDHMKILGDTLGQIAFEKAGIIKHNRPLVMYPQVQEAEQVILKRASEENSRVYRVDGLRYSITSSSLKGMDFDITGTYKYNSVHISLVGEFQVRNAATAILAAEALRDSGCTIARESIYEGLRNARWPGRFEVLKHDPCVIIDGGHNVEGIRSTAKTIRTYFPQGRILIVCGILADKQYDDMVQELLNITKEFITVTPSNPRALSAEELKSAIEHHGGHAQAAQSIRDGAELALNRAAEYDAILFCGSLYMIGEVRTVLNNIFEKVERHI
jgi:dihydrofolate synthase/folylpolyglutamate synthase